MLEKRIKELNTAKKSTIIGIEEMMDFTMEADLDLIEMEPVKNERTTSKRVKTH